MYKVRELYRQLSNGTSERACSELLEMSRNTVRSYRQLANQLNLDFNTLSKMTDEEILGKVLIIKDRGTPIQEARHNQLVRYFKGYPEELNKTGVTLKLLWKEYKMKHVDGYSYMQFTVHYNRYSQRHKASMKQSYTKGELLMIDYAGDKMYYLDDETGAKVWCSILVCILPYSGFSFAIATHTEQQEDFILGMNKAMAYFGGSTKIILSDNLRTVVKKSNRYEPDITELMLQLSAHYQITFEATRVRRPQDKGKVENAVRQVYLNVHGPFRHRTFHSLQEINTAIQERLVEHNKEAYQGRVYSRADLFIEEQPTLLPLPTTAFEVYKSKEAKVQKNYHVQLESCYYSVPYTYIGKQIMIRYNTEQVEMYHQNIRIALHAKKQTPYTYVTTKEHMPPNHVGYLETRGWDKNYFLHRAQLIGPYTLKYVEKMFDSKAYVEQAYKSLMGILHLTRVFTPEQVEKACQWLGNNTRIGYKVLENVLKQKLYNTADLFTPSTNSVNHHENLRPPDTYK